MGEIDGTGIPRVDEEDARPPSVQLAVYAAYALAITLLVFGFIGFVISNAIGNSVGGGAFVLGLIIGGATYLAAQGNSLGRAVIGLGALATAVAAVIYMFTGPGSAVIPSLVMAVLAGGVFSLLYLFETAKQFYSR
jgi:uncharacterized membrane protein (UPF0136 family)